MTTQNTGDFKCACPQCGTTYKVVESKRGRKVACKKCNTQFVLDDGGLEEVEDDSFFVPIEPQQSTFPPPLPPRASTSESTPASPSFPDRLRENPSHTGLIASFIGAGLLLLSPIFAWTTLYSTGFGGRRSLSSREWLIALPAFAVAALIFMQRNREEDRVNFAKIIGGLCLIIFMYAGYTVLSVLSAGSSGFGRLSVGVTTGMGVWLAILGSIVCGVGQIFLTQGDALSLKTKDGTRRDLSDSLREIGKRATGKRGDDADSLPPKAP